MLVVDSDGGRALTSAVSVQAMTAPWLKPKIACVCKFVNQGTWATRVRRSPTEAGRGREVEFQRSHVH